MLLKNEINELVKKFSREHLPKVSLGEHSITIDAYDQRGKVSLSTLVYFGENYIPKSVRQSVLAKHPFEMPFVPTELLIDEKHFKVYLQGIGQVGEMDRQKFVCFLEDFNDLAEKWREYLDERDQNDIVYVHAAPK